MCSAVHSKGSQLTDVRLPTILAAWREYLEIRQTVCAERISRFQVTGESGHAGAALIGVTPDERHATIYHTRALTVEDVIHELLHVAHPTWTEAHVVYETHRLWRPRLSVPSRDLDGEPTRTAA